MANKDESILEVALSSALDAKAREDALRVIVQQYLVTDESTGGDVVRRIAGAYEDVTRQFSGSRPGGVESHSRV